MTRPTILLDCDGVLSGFTCRALDEVLAVTGRAYTLEDVDRYDFCAALGLSAEDTSSVKRRIGATRGFASSLRPLPGAQDAVRRLRHLGEVYVVTSPWNSNPTWTHEREAWLERHFKISNGRVIHTSAKHLVCGDVFVDDRGDSVDAWGDRWLRNRDGRERFAIHWQNEHNRFEPSRYKRTGSWEVLIDLVARHFDDLEVPTQRRPAATEFETAFDLTEIDDNGGDA